MVKFINSKEEITTLEARKKYRGHYIGFVGLTPPDPKENYDKKLGKVLYIAETYNEQDEIPAKTEDGRRISVLYGWGLTDLPMGGITIVKKG